MRNDLPSMGPGRAAAQASHAANAFWKDNEKDEDAIEWSNQTPQGFGTAIVLSVSYEKLKEICNNLIEQFPCGSVVDPDYVISIPSEVMLCINPSLKDKFELSSKDPTKYLYHRSEVTCGYIFGDKEKLTPYLSELPLYS